MVGIHREEVNPTAIGPFSRSVRATYREIFLLHQVWFLRAKRKNQFVPNGQAHDAKTAGTFLRRRWEAKRHLVKPSEDFIEQVASVSSTSG